MIIQLNPQIPMHTPRGNGYAIAMIDYSQDHSIIWVVGLSSNGQIWSFSNEEVRLQWNVTMQRTKDGTSCLNNPAIMGE